MSPCVEVVQDVVTGLIVILSDLFQVGDKSEIVAVSKKIAQDYEPWMGSTKRDWREAGCDRTVSPAALSRSREFRAQRHSRLILPIKSRPSGKRI
jgi:hypothetical protein